MMHPDRFSGRPPAEVKLATIEFQRITLAMETLIREVKQARPKATRGANIEVSLSISTDTAQSGGIATVEWPGMRGQSIRIPAGSREGTRLRIAGKGHPGAHGGESGDVIVQIKVLGIRPETHPRADRAAPGSFEEPTADSGGPGANRWTSASPAAAPKRRGVPAWGVVAAFIAILGAIGTAAFAMMGVAGSSDAVGNEIPVDRSEPSSMAVTQIDASEVPCDTSESNGCWTWRIVPSKDCARAKVVIALSSTENGSVAAYRYNALSNLVEGEARAFTTGVSAASGPDFARIESVICES